MALSLNKPKLDNLTNEIWKSAERLRGKFKAYEYQAVILPIIVIRRLECVLLSWREVRRIEILSKHPKLTEKEVTKRVKDIELNPKQSPFSNKTTWTLRKVYEEDHTLLEENFRAYINGFSKNVDDIIEHFNYRATIGTMVKNNRLAPILNQYKDMELGPGRLSGLEMGYIYEELLRLFSQQSGEEDHLWTFLADTQSETIRKLAEDYGTDARDEVFRALKDELKRSPLWLIIRHGLKVRGVVFRLFYPKPRSEQSEAGRFYDRNRITFRPHFYFGDKHEKVDLVLFLNGLPIAALELKHEAGSQGWNVHNAVEQFAQRDHAQRIFQLPFLYIAADTSDVMVATDPRRVQNFRWFNTGLSNQPINEGEYPVEFLYREVLSKERLLEALSFFLIHVPKRDATVEQPEHPAFSLFPRYHQSRMVRKVADAALEHLASTGNIGRKFLINHSAGSGKTLSICWLADRLHSLYKPGTNEKLVDMVVILTDRKSLDKNIRDDIEKFAHLKDVVGLAKSSGDLARFLKQRTSIIVTTQQKFAWILEQIEHDPELKTRRVAFLIDEAHRSQEGQLGAAIRLPFRNSDEPDAEDAKGEGDDEEEIARIIREHDNNQLFVAFTATPAPATVTLFGAAFDTYTEAEAIEEGYIVDVASSILSYRTLYNLHCPLAMPDKEFPKATLAKALRNVAFQDDELIQYKAEVMLRIFDEQVKPLIGGRAKAMIVATSRLAGLRYFQILKEKLRERGAGYKALYAFSDFTHPETNEAISEHAINELDAGELIEDRFEREDYRLMIVANKFQTGFDQPLLAGMFLDKAVVDRNAVQTVSRLNRCHDGKDTVVVVDFTNNAQAIMRAFTKYRKGSPYEPGEPDGLQCETLYREILAADVFTQEDAQELVLLLTSKNDARIQTKVHELRLRFQGSIADHELRRGYVHLLARFVKSFQFLSCFFSYDYFIREFADFADCIGPQLVKAGTVSDMMKMVRATTVVKAAVLDQGEVTLVGSRKSPGGKARKSGGVPLMKVSVQDMISEIREAHEISDDEALYIKEVTEEKIADEGIKSTVIAHHDDGVYLNYVFKERVNRMIQDAYSVRGLDEELGDPKYYEDGAIFDIMAMTVIGHHLPQGAHL
ncbi:MAG TPA: type I restriction endonuclease subunit R [Gallionellaceae bacterium]|nr:type I restriction endonuclease subunit R [Gallionellaceae bacterium]